MSLERRFETPGQLQLRVDNKSGPVRVRAHPGDTTVVSVVAEGNSVDEVLDNIRVDHHESSGWHRVLVDVPGRWGGLPAGTRARGGGWRVDVLGLGDLIRSPFRDGAEVTVTVDLPEGATVEVVTSSGTVTLDGNFGPTTVETASGDVLVGACAGDLNVRSQSGDVNVRRVTGEARITTASGDVDCGPFGGASRVKTASGDVSVQKCAGPLTVQTATGDATAGELHDGCQFQSASGDLRVDRLIAGRARLETVSGDLDIGVARSTLVAVDAETVSGDLSSEIELDEDEPRPSGEGAQGMRVDLRARTVSGDLRIRRAAS